MLFKKKKDLEEILDEENIEEEETASGSRFIIMPLIYETALLGFLFLKNTTAAINYLYALIPLLALTAFIGTYLYNHDGDMKLFNAAAVLTATGTALQLLIDQVYHPITTYSLLKMLIGIAIAFVFLLMYSLFRKLLKTSFTVYLMMAACAGIYILLYLKGSDPNGYGTSAWITIGSLTFQLTDFTKVAAVIFYGALFSTSSSRSDNQILIITSIFFFINLIGSVLIHELGSFFILYFLHLSILFIFMNKGKTKRIYLITIFVLTLAALGMAFLLYHILLPSYQAGTLSSFTSLIWSIVNKIHTRFSVTANIYADPNGAGYQLLQGKKALWMGGLFGNTVNFHSIPVAESDMAFVALVNGFGWIIALFCVGMFWRIMRSGSELSRKLLKRDVMDSVVIYGITVLIFMQAMLVILGSCNIVPFAGLPIAFLSRGNTYGTLVFCFIGLLLRGSEDDGEKLIQIDSEEEGDSDDSSEEEN